MSTINRLHACGILTGFLLTCGGTQAASAQSAPYHGTPQYQSNTVVSTTGYQGTQTSIDTGQASEYGGDDSSYRERELPIWTIGYSMALGVGDLNDYIADASFRGFEVTLLWPAYQGLFLGLGFGYNGFYEQKPQQTRQLESAAVTARAYNYTDAWPLSGIARYVFLQSRSPVRPYLGIRTGVILMDSTTLVTDRSYNDSSAGWLLAPEAGLLAHLSKSVMASLQYTFNFSTASTIGGDTLSYNNLMVGLALQP
jgi:hypothetical protein